MLCIGMNVQSCGACCAVDSALLACCSSFVSLEYHAASEHGLQSVLNHNLLCSVTEGLCGRVLTCAV